MAVYNGAKPRGEGGGTDGPGGTNQRNSGKSWAELLGSSLPTSLKKNLLEVVLEKDERGAFMVSEDDVARLLRKIGLDPRPGVQVEEVQICPTGRGVILITLKNDVQVENFCRYDVLEVTECGIRSTMVKQAGKKDMVVTLKGIHPNTRDSMVLDYLSKFGKVVTTKVVHGVFFAGPLKGMRNGDRSFKLEIKPGENIGSYHVLEGQKVSLRYAGQQQTCNHCHETPRNCTGGGIAKKFREGGGVRIEFSDYILALWNKIGYSPQNADLSNDINEDQEMEQHVQAFTPQKTERSKEVYAGVNIRQFPKEYDQGEVMEFLCRSGLPETKKDEVILRSNGIVTIKNLDDITSNLLITAIHGKQNFGKKLFCNGIIPLTPKKDAPNVDTPIDKQLGDQHGSIPSQPAVPPSVASESGAGLDQLLAAQHGDLATALPQQCADQHGNLSPQSAGNVSGDHTAPVKPVNSSSIQQPATTPPGDPPAAGITPAAPGTKSATVSVADFVASNLSFPDFLTNREVVRRHSISILDSIAADIILEPRPDMSKTNLLVNELKECLSDFGSCISVSESSNVDDSDSRDSKESSNNASGWQNMNEKKRLKKKKRKLKLTPGKEEFKKKPNLTVSN